MNEFIISLLEQLYYNSVQGKLYWRQAHKNKRTAGFEAGHIHKDGDKKTAYRRLQFKGKNYYVHRLIWLIETGEWPKGTVDHKDHNGLNNVFSNMRDVCPTTQNLNRTVFKCSKTGICGVILKNKNYIASIIIKTKKFYLYSGKDFFLACCARKSFDNKIG